MEDEIFLDWENKIFLFFCNSYKTKDEDLLSLDNWRNASKGMFGCERKMMKTFSRVALGNVHV